MTEARVLIYDIENTPLLGFAWGKYQTDLLEIVEDSHLLSFAYKWAGDKKVQAVSLPDFKLWKKDPSNDYEVAAALWQLHDEADIVIAHNGNRFDQAKARARFEVHRLGPPSPFREIDTLQVARKKFRFSANNLDELCRQLGIGRKEYTGGFDTWLHCMGYRGTPEEQARAWRRMVKYNKRDVGMLEELYLRFRPWIDNHPSLALIEGRPDACPKCGSDKGMIIRGNRKINAVTVNTVFQCKACGGYVTARLPDKATPKPEYKG